MKKLIIPVIISFLFCGCLAEIHQIESPALEVNVSSHPRENCFIADITLTAQDETTDMTLLIQNALNQCASDGGGTVYLSAGKYKITKNINIPSYVTLCGDNSEQSKTIILADVVEKDSTTEGLFNVGGSAGVLGLTVYYPNQNINNVKKYPFTFYIDGLGSHYMMQTIKNCTVINGYRGIGACGEKKTNRVHEMLMVENFKGTFLLEGSEIYNQADVGVIQNVNISPEFWQDYCLMSKEDKTKLEQYTKEHTTGLVLSAMDWPQCDNISISSCKTEFIFPKDQELITQAYFQG